MISIVQELLVKVYAAIMSVLDRYVEFLAMAFKGNGVSRMVGSFVLGATLAGLSVVTGGLLAATLLIAVFLFLLGVIEAIGIL